MTDIIQKINKYCLYQERCHSEVRNKLYELGCRTAEVDDVLALLIEKEVVNEERFACAFARGKFRMKQWGRQKIKHELKLKKISDYCITKALREIDNTEYQTILTTLATRKLKDLNGVKNVLLRKSKLYRYLTAKGYEADLVQSVVNETIR